MVRKAEPTWAGRIPGGLAPEAWAFLHSLPHDRFLWPYDVTGTIAHVHGLEAAGVLKKAEASKLRKELEAIKDHPELIDETDEDVHSAIERVLTQRLGDVGARVHAGRSRNDQVATAMRLWARDQIAVIAGSVAELIETLADRAAQTAGDLAPGYTHLQRAQPITIGHWLCAHGVAFVRDLDRLSLAQKAADVSPLGAGALAGSTLPIDPKVAQTALGFKAVFDNSIDAVSDRDYLCDVAYACATTLIHLSRLAEEIVLWSTTEFGFIGLPDGYATGSSMMPQKKNPDVAELARGSTGVAVGALTGLLVTLKALPLAYDRDLQIDKQQVRGTTQVTVSAVRAMSGLVASMTFDVASMTSAASDDALLATDAAEQLVRGGTSFRVAHEQIAKAAAAGEVLAPGMDARSSVAARTSGGPAPSSVKAQVRKLRRAAAKALRQT